MSGSEVYGPVQDSIPNRCDLRLSLVLSIGRTFMFRGNGNVPKLGFSDG